MNTKNHPVSACCPSLGYDIPPVGYLATQHHDSEIMSSII